MVLERGFAWNGETYGSLSQVAKAMTGTTWNGHRFFGLRTAKSDRTAKVSRNARVSDDAPPDTRPPQLTQAAAKPVAATVPSTSQEPQPGRQRPLALPTAGTVGRRHRHDAREPLFEIVPVVTSKETQAVVKPHLEALKPPD